MLLKALYDLANSPDRGILKDLAFTQKSVRWIIELDKTGNLLGHGPVETGDGKRGQEFSCPQTTRDKLAGGVAEFLADGIIAVFGLDNEPDVAMPTARRAARDKNNARKKEDYWRQIEDAAKDVNNSDLRAISTWIRNCGPQPGFLQWQAATGKAKKGAWLVLRASGEQKRMGPDNFTFRVDGRLLLENEQLRSWWRSQHAKERAGARAGAAHGICLVSGFLDQPIPATNDKISGVPNTAAFGGAIVSFDKDAFASYGFDQNLNAPISEDVATAYCAALNWLLDRKDHHLQIGGSVLCFWARGGEQHTGLFASLLNEPQPDAVRSFVLSPWSGMARNLAQHDQFCAVTLCGNAGRIAVRHWMQCPLDMVVENLAQWFGDLAIETPCEPTRTEKHAPLSVRSLAECTAPLKKKNKFLIPDDEKLMPDLSSALYRAALEGAAPPVSLVKPLLDQLISRMLRDERYNVLQDESRFALLKLILNRVNRNRKEPDMEIQPKLTANTADPAYNCGRLLAVFDDLQRRSHEWKLTGSSVAERYYASASAAPATIFGILWRLHLHHLKKLRSLGGKYAAAVPPIERKIWEIAELFRQTPELADRGAPPDFPRTLDLQAQGRFALGFYQQKAEEQASIAARAARDLDGTNEQTTKETKE